MAEQDIPNICVQVRLLGENVFNAERYAIFRLFINKAVKRGLTSSAERLTARFIFYHADMQGVIKIYFYFNAFLLRKTQG